MKITFIIPSLSCGGAEGVLSMIANSLSEKGHFVSILTWDGPSNPPYYALHPSIQHQALGIAGPSTSYLNSISNIIRRLKVLRQSIRKTAPDVVVSFLVETNMMVLLSLWGTRLPVVVAERIDPSRYPTQKWMRALRLCIYRLADRVVVQTQGALNYFPSSIRNRSVVIPNPVSPVLNDTSGTPHGFKRPLAVAMGRLDHQKGFDLLLSAFSKIASQFPEWTLVILGEGPERQRLEEFIGKAGLSKRVFLLGRVDHPSQFLKQCDLFVMPSRFEGFPNSLAEAMACGLPVIASNCVGCRDLVRHEVDGLLFPNEDLRRFVDALKDLMSNEKKRLDFGRNAKKIVDRFSFKDISASWEAVIQEVKGDL